MQWVAGEGPNGATKYHNGGVEVILEEREQSWNSESAHLPPMILGRDENIPQAPLAPSLFHYYFLLDGFLNHCEIEIIATTSSHQHDRSYSRR